MIRSQCGTLKPAMACPVSGCVSTRLLPETPPNVIPLARSIPAPIAPWCRLALPCDMRVGKRVMAMTG